MCVHHRSDPSELIQIMFILLCSLLFLFSKSHVIGSLWVRLTYAMLRSQAFLNNHQVLFLWFFLLWYLINNNIHIFQNIFKAPCTVVHNGELCRWSHKNVKTLFELDKKFHHFIQNNKSHKRHNIHITLNRWVISVCSNKTMTNYSGT